jgi:ribosomal protein L27
VGNDFTLFALRDGYVKFHNKGAKGRFVAIEQPTEAVAAD